MASPWRKDTADQGFVIGNASRLQVHRYNMIHPVKRAYSIPPAPERRAVPSHSQLPSPVYPVIKDNRLVAGMVQRPHDGVARAGGQRAHNQGLQGAPEAGLARADGNPVLHEAKNEQDDDGDDRRHQ